MSVRYRPILLGALIGLMLAATLAARQGHSDAARYQISAYGISNTHGVYVVETWTGVVKQVSVGISYAEHRGNQLGVPFDSLRNTVSRTTLSESDDRF